MLFEQSNNTVTTGATTDPLSLYFSGEKDFGNFAEMLSFCINSHREDWSNAYEELKDKRAAVIAAVTAFPMGLGSLPTQFREDKEVVLAAVREDGAALQFASRGLRDDEEVVKEARRAGGHAVRFASTRLKEFWIRKAVRKNIPGIEEEELERRVSFILARVMPEY